MPEELGTARKRELQRQGGAPGYRSQDKKRGAAMPRAGCGGSGRAGTAVAQSSLKSLDTRRQTRTLVHSGGLPSMRAIVARESRPESMIFDDGAGVVSSALHASEALTLEA
jgi:hypothetical protein